MKIRKYSFIFGLVIGTSSLIVCAENHLPQSDKASLLSAHVNPALAGVEKLYVILKPSNAESDEDGLVWSDLQRKIEQKLQTAGLKIVPEIEDKDRNMPELRVTMEMLKFNQSQLYVFRLQLSFATKVYLKQQNVSFKAEAWKTEPVMEAVSEAEMPAKVTYAVLEQTEAFIRAYKLANSTAVPLRTDTNDISASTQQQSDLGEEQTAEYKYIASKNSKVFHKPDCIWVKKIKPENLTGYSSRDEAINAGKKACSVCKP